MRMVQKLREKIAAGKPVIGTFLVELRAPGVVAVLKTMDFDFFVIDSEHGAYSPHEIIQLIDAGLQHGVCPMVRVSGPDHGEISHALDGGAEGVFIPMARSMECVREAVQQSKYHPVGRRGSHFGCRHTAFDGPASPEGVVEYMARANAELMTVIQIETAESAELIDDIAATDGVDSLYIGPRDLSAGLDLAMDTNHARIHEVCQQIAAACDAHGKIAGGHLADPARIAGAFESGMPFLGYASAIQIFKNGASQYRKDIGEALAKE